MTLVPRAAATAMATIALTLAVSGGAEADTWSSRYDGAGASTDTAKAITTDSAGNVYVTGASVGLGQTPGTTDVAILKYNAVGVQQWASRLDGLSKHNDGGEAIAVDAAGNVFVAGYSTNVGSGMDYVTAKFNSAGVKQWHVIEQGPGGGADVIYAMAIDASSNVYVTGTFNNASGDNDIRTIKYNSNGAEQWSRDLSTGADDAGFAIAVDDSGNAYVAGRSGSAGAYNYRVIKYGPSGTQLWTQTYNGPAGTNDEAYAIAVDPSGNVYVTGYSNGSGTGSDYATVKYDPNGSQQWAARYNGTAGSSDEARSIGLDASGDVFVTGASMDTGATSGFATIKYGSNGTEQWVKREDSGLGYDGARKLAVHSGGDVYVCGDFTVGGQGFNQAYFRYDNAGFRMQSSTYNGPGGAADRGYAIAVSDTTKAIYVTGPSRGTSSDDFATAKYDNATLATTIIASDVYGAATQNKNLTATLTRTADGSGRPGRTVSFQVNGVVVGSAVTDGSGVATLAYTMPGYVPLSVHTISASFSGDTDYNASSDTSNLNVLKLSEITIWNRSGTVTKTIAIRAHLRVNTYPYAGATIRFKVDGVQIGTAVTGANGVAILSHTLSEALGNHSLTAEFDGDSEGAPVSSAPVNLLVKIIKTDISVATLAIAPGRTTNLRARLRGGDETLANRTLSFKLDGVAIGTANTDSNGLATLPHAVTEALGDHTITVEFAGEAGLYDTASSTGTLTVRANTRIIADRISAPAGSLVNFGATLMRNDMNAPMEGKALSFYEGETLLGTAVTDVNGRAEIPLNAPASGVTRNITIRFGGEPTFRQFDRTGRIIGQ